jgi:gluconokinase
MPTVSRAEAEAPFVLSLDIGSSSIRVMVFDRQARDIAGLAAKAAYPVNYTDDGGVEADADEVLEALGQAIDATLRAAGPLAAQIGAVASCSLVSNVLGVAHGRPCTPAYFYSDTRSAPDTAALRGQVDHVAWHQRVGTVIHTSYLPPRFLWLQRTAPDLLAGAEYWMSLGEYFYLRFFGRRACSLSVASWTGLLNRTALTWDPETLALLPIHSDQLSPLVDLTEAQGGLGAEFAARWPALARIPWLPTVGDGATANLGSGCATPQQIALTVGTSGAMRVVQTAPVPRVPAGLWLYRVDRRRALLGGALSNGGVVYEWMTTHLNLAAPGPLEAQIAAMAPDEHGLTVLPFFAGERSPGWQPDAAGAITGLRVATSAVEILRAGLEAVAYRFALIYAGLRPDAGQGARFVASGAGLLHSPAWMQIMADVLGVPLVASAEPEASSRGNALLGLEVLGAIADAGALPGAVGATYAPDPARHAVYLEAIARQRDLYARIFATPTQGE